MDKMIKASLEEGKSGKSQIYSTVNLTTKKKIVLEVPKFPSSIKSMSQIERDYKQVKSSNILDKEYSAWYSYKK